MGTDPRSERNDRSERQERQRASEVGGRRSAGSGSSYRSPGDVRTDDVLEELKFTDKKSFSLKLAQWEDIKAKALKLGREPRMVIEFHRDGERAVRLIIEEK